MKPAVKFSRPDAEGFFRTMMNRVNDYFRESGVKKTGNWKMYLKTAVMVLTYVTPFILVLLQVFPDWVAIILYALMAFGKTGIGLAVMHDANHGSYSTNKTVNKIMARSMEIIGGSSFTWNIQHNIMHHSYTNIYGLDEDIDDKPFLRLSPHGKYKAYHRFQHIYAMVLYSMATLSWLLFKDFKQLVHYNRTGLTEKSGSKPTKETLRMLGSKALYVLCLVVLPLAMGVAWWAVLLGFLLMHLITGFIITIIFQLAHVVEGPSHHTPEKTGTMENTWAIHQLITTANFACQNRFVTWFTGGLNHQIEHHLFPSICHIHYRKISRIVRQTAKEFGLPYHEFPKFRLALMSHLGVLREFGQPA
ncbi:MAG: acyl-CoA desaturase [Bacteroidetes bacterium]|nr:acyl-CoA desaturase [Bacteroidota bacterium]